MICRIEFQQMLNQISHRLILAYRSQHPHQSTPLQLILTSQSHLLLTSAFHLDHHPLQASVHLCLSLRSRQQSYLMCHLNFLHQNHRRTPRLRPRCGLLKIRRLSHQRASLRLHRQSVRMLSLRLFRRVCHPMHLHRNLRFIHRMVPRMYRQLHLRIHLRCSLRHYRQTRCQRNHRSILRRELDISDMP